ncbi:MAG: flavin reductase [Alphaproteobacteria bacterium]|nr:MAG: flavin reductase [Alphaproteobacteria bacterium]
MPINVEEFRQAMRRLGGAVNIVTAANGDVWAGLTATAVTSLSAEPPRLLACINRQGATFDTLSKGRVMGVNVLGTAFKDLALRFAGLDGQPETDRFTDDVWDTAITGAPLLKGAMVGFDCRVESILDAGSHGIVIGTIEAVVFGGRTIDDPLCYIDGKWATLRAIG